MTGAVAASSMILPPYAATLNIGLAPDGSPSMLLMRPGDALLGRPGFLHGGALTALLEMTGFAVAANAIDDGDVRIELVTMTVDFLRGAKLVDTRGDGRIIRSGRRIVALDVRAWQDDPDRPIATARMNLSIDRE